jgi:hypothetical protein
VEEKRATVIDRTKKTVRRSNQPIIQGKKIFSKMAGLAIRLKVQGRRADIPC